MPWTQRLYPRSRDVAAALQRADSPAAAQHRQQLHREATWLRTLDPPTVDNKPTRLPRPSPDPHDYVSIATYWWPNPDTPDGLPYVHRDGEFSPVLDRYDRLGWDLHCDGIAVLAQMHQVSGRHDPTIRDWLEAWYVDPATRMNPHLRHAQFRPGHDEGRMVGCIDFTVRLPRFLEVLRRVRAQTDLIEGPTFEAVECWWGQWLDWLAGPDVRAWHDAAENNLGVYYDRALIDLALWLGREDLADEQLGRVATNRLARQIEPDGRLPHELKRTRSFDYTLMTVLGLIDLAALGEARGMDLFEASRPGCGTIADAVDWVWQHAAGAAPWPAPQLGGVAWDRLLRLWWCLPDRHRNRYPLEAVAHRFDPARPLDPEAGLRSFRLHPFHQPVWKSHPRPPCIRNRSTSARPESDGSDPAG
jgi:hypothetical protein